MNRRQVFKALAGAPLAMVSGTAGGENGVWLNMISPEEMRGRLVYFEFPDTKLNRERHDGLFDEWWKVLASQDGNWVDRLQSPTGDLCCSNNDGRRLDDPEWRIRPGDDGQPAYDVLFTEGWLPVPRTAVVKSKNQDGITRVWSTVTDGKRTIRCFLPGALS